jgi:glycine hydroxymethyltransferase
MSDKHLSAVAATDPVMADLLAQEEQRQYYTAKLIASENYASLAVLQASGTVLTNKYSEGYAGKRYYEGQQIIDPIESLAVSRAKALFGADHVNVQPYSGSPANLAMYCGLLPKEAPNQRILALGLPAGGHLTHGWKVSMTARFFEFAHYGVSPETHRFDFDAIRKQAHEFKPALIMAGCTAYPRIVEFDKFAEIAQEVGALLVADMAHIAGLVAGGAHPSPIPYAAAVGTTTHKTLRGPRSGMLLCKQAYAAAIDKAVFPGLQGGPHNHTTAALAVALHEAAQPDFAKYAHQTVANSQALADELQKEGFSVVTGGSDNHLVLFSTMPLGATGKQAAKAMDVAGLEANFNSIPFDPQPPMNPSGVRVGTAALTSRGLVEADLRQVGRWIAAAVRNKDDADALRGIASEVHSLMAANPPPGFSSVPVRP